jgi:hypothetical protein
MLDVDFIEWRIRDGELVAVGVMEVTRVDNGITVTQAYLDAIISRFEVEIYRRKQHARWPRHWVRTLI